MIISETYQQNRPAPNHSKTHQIGKSVYNAGGLWYENIHSWNVIRSPLYFQATMYTWLRYCSTQHKTTDKSIYYVLVVIIFKCWYLTKFSFLYSLLNQQHCLLQQEIDMNIKLLTSEFIMSWQIRLAVIFQKFGEHKAKILSILAYIRCFFSNRSWKYRKTSSIRHTKSQILFFRLVLQLSFAQSLYRVQIV